MHAGYLLVEFRRKREWSQIELAHAIGFSKGVMSEIENGKRFLSGHYLQKIEEAYIFEEHELRMLREQAAIDRVRDEFGIDLSERLRTPFEGLEDLLNNSRILRRRSGLTSIGELIPSQIALLETFKERYPADKQRIDRLIGKALVERLDGFRQTLSEHEIIDRTSADLKLLRLTQKSLSNDPEDYDLAHLLPTTILYVARQLKDNEQLKQLVTQLSEPYPMMVCARGLVALNAILRDQGKLGLDDAIYQFKQAEEMAQKVISSEKISAGEKVSMYEALSFGRALLGLPEAYNYLQQAKVTQEQAGQDETALAVMDGLLVRTEVIISTLDKDMDIQTILDVAEKGAQIAKERGYKRQQSQIISRLLNHFDADVRELGLHLRNTI